MNLEMLRSDLKLTRQVLTKMREQITHLAWMLQEEGALPETEEMLTDSFRMDAIEAFKKLEKWEAGLGRFMATADGMGLDPNKVLADNYRENEAFSKGYAEGRRKALQDVLSQVNSQLRES